MRQHTRNNRRQQRSKANDEDRYLSSRQEGDRSDPYARPHQSSEDYRNPSTSSRGGGFGMEREPPSSSHQQREADAWRRAEPSFDSYSAYDGHRGGRDDYEVDARDEDPYYPQDSTRGDWSHRYEQAHSAPYPDSSWNGSASSSYAHRTAPPDTWGAEEDGRQRFGSERRHNNGTQERRRGDRDGQSWKRDQRREKAQPPPRFQSDSGWDTRRRGKTFDDQPRQETPIDDISQPSPLQTSYPPPPPPPPPPPADRQWEPSSSWKASNAPSSTTSNKNENQQRRNQKSGKNKNKRAQNGQSKKRDWRQDDGPNPNKCVFFFPFFLFSYFSFFFFRPFPCLQVSLSFFSSLYYFM